MSLLYEGNDWDFQKLDAAYKACEEIALGELGLSVYQNQIEVITSEQMLDAYSSVGLPLMYRHWSFGKRFTRDEGMYRAGQRGLAYEIVINSNPCISYVMEENSMTMQTLVLAHACFGHNHFFKNNHLFKQWTDADGILDYLAFAKKFVEECEERHGFDAVERILDAAHALQGQGVHRYPRRKWRLADEERRAQDRRTHEEATYDQLWTTIPGFGDPGEDREKAEPGGSLPGLYLPEENLLYLCEKYSPRLRPWERELVRIVRVIAQYFYPQMQTKMSNEGCATSVHYAIMTRLHDRGQIDDGAFLEFLRSHTAVISQPKFTERHFSGWNPYALGFAIMRDVERACLEPDEEDLRWFPGFAGNGDPWGTLRDAWADYRDESMIRQFMGPKVMREFRMIHLADRRGEDAYRVADIHDDEGYRRIRGQLADEYDPANAAPLIEATGADLAGSRKLVLKYACRGGNRLHEPSAKLTLRHLQVLWGYPVVLQETEEGSDKVLSELLVG